MNFNKADSTLRKDFLNPPDSAKPYTWWHWMSGNISKDGITRDLEAMSEAGLGGCFLFDVAGAVAGSVGFDTEEYYDLLHFAALEAQRLGLEFGMHNCNGWSASGGPWITPEHSMKTVVSSEKIVDAKTLKNSFITLPPLPKKEGWSKTISVYAWPKSLTDKAHKLHFYDPYDQVHQFAPNESFGKLKVKDLINLTDKLDGDRLNWTPKEGKWLVIRIGASSTGAINAPARQGARGLEVDKLSRESFDIFWEGFMEKVVQKMGSLNGNGFNNVTFDSFEKGAQNWTANMIEEFKARRGYDPSPWLPVLAGYAVNGKEESAGLFGIIAERFLNYWLKTMTVE